MNERDRILGRIRACLALGDRERNPSEQEASTAIAMAKKLMSQYNLSMADVAFSEANVGKIREEALKPRAGVPKWETDVARVCDNLFGTKHFLKDTSVRSSTTGCWVDRRAVVFYGYDVDVSLSVEVYKLLKLEILGMARRWEVREASDKTYLTPGQLRGRRFAYCDGVVWTLISRSSNKEAEALSRENAAKVRDLVIRKSANLEDWAKKQHPDFLPVRRRESNLHDDATLEGTTDGRNVSLSFKSAVRGGTEKLGIEHKGGTK